MAFGVRWLIAGYSQTWLNGTVVVHFDTDRPVHVWLRWTDTPPLMHLQSLEHRGLTKMSDPYYCFVAYWEIEQDEAGDSLQHTFTWPGWVDCNWRWFLFWATASGQTTPTQWGIFSKHYTAPREVTLLVYANGFYKQIPWPADKSTHWSRVRANDTTWYPPDIHYIYGHFEGDYVWVRIYNSWTWYTSTFQVHSLPLDVTDILKVAVWMVVGKVYVYGRAKTALYIDGTLFEGPQVSIGGPGLRWYFTEYSTNPVTGIPWTVAQVNTLEAGLSLAHAGTFGLALCDQVYVVVTHRPAP